MAETTDREKQLTANIEALLRHMASESRPCRECGVQLWMLRHLDTGKFAPYTYDGTNHFVDCPAATKFKRPAATPTVPRETVSKPAPQPKQLDAFDQHMADTEGQA